MSKIFGIPLDAAYYVVTALAGALTPLTGTLAVALSIVLFTIAVRLLVLPFSFYALRGQLAQARLAPQIQTLRQKFRRDPERMNREVRALYRANGTSMFAGYLPLLLQRPFLTVMYLLFRSATINGAPNTLLRHHLFGAPLSAHWLTTPGPVSLQGAVFAGVFVLLALTGILSARHNRRLFPRPTPASIRTASSRTVRTSTSNTAPNRTRGTVATGAKGGRALAPKSTAATKTPLDSPVAPATTPSWLTNVLPLVTVVFAAFLPLAGGLYLLTTTAWTLLERRVLARYAQPAPPSPAESVKVPAQAG
jgi:YidC/Oxa1 family membrane protein insertase